MKLARTKLSLAVILSLAFTPLAAQDFQKGVDAFLENDYATALQEWTPLAEAGEGKAQILLGNLYHNGNGVIQDYDQALKWYLLAAAQGYSSSQNLIGQMYQTGQGVPLDYAEALKWFRLAAALGSDEARFSIGIMYEFGTGVLKNNVMAHMWYNISSANGNENAGERRDELTASMTAEDVSKAQSMARECMSSGYTDCGY